MPVSRCSIGQLFTKKENAEVGHKKQSFYEKKIPVSYSVKVYDITSKVQANTKVKLSSKLGFAT